MRVLVACEYSGRVHDAFLALGHDAMSCDLPWWFGHGETKATCLWLKNLPKLMSTNVVDGREARVHKMAPGPDRWKERSRTLEGVAAAFAQQWGGT